MEMKIQKMIIEMLFLEIQEKSFIHLTAILMGRWPQSKFSIMENLVRENF